MLGGRDVKSQWGGVAAEGKGFVVRRVFRVGGTSSEQGGGGCFPFLFCVWGGRGGCSCQDVQGGRLGGRDMKQQWEGVEVGVRGVLVRRVS